MYVVLNFFIAISKLASSEHEYSLLLEKSFHDCCQEGLLGQKILSTLSRQKRPELMKKLLKTNATDLRDIHINDLPPEWSSKATNRSSSGKDHRHTKLVAHNTGRRRVRY